MNLEEWGRKLQQDKQIERFPDAKEMFAADPYEIHLFQRECNGWIIAENGWVIWDSIECGGGLSLRSFLAFLYTAEEQGSSVLHSEYTDFYVARLPGTPLAKFGVTEENFHYELGVDFPALLQQWKAEVRYMLSDASVERQCQFCAQDVSENYCKEHLEEFAKESRQMPSPDDWIGKMGEDEAWVPVYLQTVNLLRTDPWLGIHGEQCTMEDITRWVKKKCRD